MKPLMSEWKDLVVGPIEFTRSLALPSGKAIKIYDTTLRDGEQMPGVALTPRQKQRIAIQIARLGCHIIDLGFPASSDGEREALRLVLEARRSREIPAGVELLVMCRANPGDIRATVDAVRAAGVLPHEITYLIFTSSSALHCKYKLGPLLLKRVRRDPRELHETPLEFFEEQNRSMVVEALEYARSLGITRIEFGCEDASRTPIDKLIELVRTAVDHGATRYIFADTTGTLSAHSTLAYCLALSEAFPGIERASHFHNDFGLAAANAITGVLAGFPIFSTTVNGIGERAGNAPLHSVVTALKYLYGLEIPGFRYDMLASAARLVEDATGIPIPPHEPIIGCNAFAHESGIHVHGVGTCREMYEPLPYNEVGGAPRVVFGKHSGCHAVYDVLSAQRNRIAGPVTWELARAVLAQLKEMRQAMAGRGDAARFVREHRRHVETLGLTEADVVSVAKDICLSAAIDAKQNRPCQWSGSHERQNSSAAVGGQAVGHTRDHA